MRQKDVYDNDFIYKTSKNSEVLSIENTILKYIWRQNEINGLSNAKKQINKIYHFYKTRKLPLLFLNFSPLRI